MTLAYVYSKKAILEMFSQFEKATLNGRRYQTQEFEVGLDKSCPPRENKGAQEVRIGSWKLVLNVVNRRIQRRSHGQNDCTIWELEIADYC
jgi:hypothetical protein